MLKYHYRVWRGLELIGEGDIKIFAQANLYTRLNEMYGYKASGIRFEVDRVYR